MRIGRVTGREIKKNRDGSGSRLLLQVEMSNANDVQTVEMVNAPGEDTSPVNDSQVIIFDIGKAFKVALAGNDGIVPVATPGEYEIYSSSGGSKKTRFKLYTDEKAALFNSSKDLLTLIEGLIDTVKAIITVGSPTQHVISPASQTALESYKTEFQGLLKNGA